jgi:heterodisulfide reductase subunit A
MKRNVLIIGGGPAGIEAAHRIRDYGHTPILIEKEPRLGGHLAKWHKLFPDGESTKELLTSLTSDLEGINCFTDTNIISINKLKDLYVAIFSNGISVQADAILFATGFSMFPAEKKEEYGYGIYNHVITNADLENYFNTGNDPRIQDPKVIGFVHCVGSRDEKAGNRQCSKVCCATAIKQACEMKELYPDATVYCFYMDLRMFGRKYEDLYLNAQRKYGIFFVRGRVSEVSENIDGRLVVKAEDTLFGKPLKITMDLLVLMAGMSPCVETPEIASMTGVHTGEDGFFMPRDLLYRTTESHSKGIFFAGATTGPKTIPETLNEARAAAIAIDNYFKEKAK